MGWKRHGFIDILTEWAEHVRHQEDHLIILKISSGISIDGAEWVENDKDL